nr:hypothetical protein [Micromonospora sp. DSM 115978]
PTFDVTAQFEAEYGRLTPAERAAFRAALRLFIEGIRDGGYFHPRLRVKSYTSINGVFEMSWAKNGRALWRYGDPLPATPHERHVQWLAVGSHSIYKRPVLLPGHDVG